MAAAENAATAASIRSRPEVWGLLAGSAKGHDYHGPKEGTTASRNGSPDAPVYYDWQANWERVEKLVRTPAMQRILKYCIGETKWNDPHHYWHYK